MATGAQKSASIKFCSLTATFLLTDVEGSTALWE
jgi:hypothetical protein